jgi:hypothetical protein
MTSLTPMLMCTSEPTECQARLPSQTRSISEVMYSTMKQWQTNPFLAERELSMTVLTKSCPLSGRPCLGVVISVCVSGLNHIKAYIYNTI